MSSLAAEQLLRRIRDLEAWRRRLVLPEGDIYPAWDDLQVNISSVRIPTSGAPTWTAYKGSYVLAFSASARETIYFTAQLPHGYQEGSDIEFHLHLAYPDGNAGHSVWNFTHSWADIGDTFPAPTTVANVVIDAPGVADYHQIAEIEDSIDGSDKNISSVLLCSLQRDGTSEQDDYGSDVYLVALDFHIQVDSLGSRTETEK